MESTRRSRILFKEAILRLYNNVIITKVGNSTCAQRRIGKFSCVRYIIKKAPTWHGVHIVQTCSGAAHFSLAGQRTTQNEVDNNEENTACWRYTRSSQVARLFRPTKSLCGISDCERLRFNANKNGFCYVVLKGHSVKMIKRKEVALLRVYLWNVFVNKYWYFFMIHQRGVIGWI